MSKHPLAEFRENHTPPLSQADLATLLDVQRQSVWRWETGERFPERNLWEKIEKLTGLNAIDLNAAVPADNAGTVGNAPRLSRVQRARRSGPNRGARGRQ